LWSNTVGVHQIKIQLITSHVRAPAYRHEFTFIQTQRSSSMEASKEPIFP
jgi:hypothetical protein